MSKLEQLLLIRLELAGPLESFEMGVAGYTGMEVAFARAALQRAGLIRLTSDLQWDLVRSLR
jgi:hypothetical protein